MVLSWRFFYSAEFRIGRFRHRVSAGFRSEKSYRPPAGRMRFSTVRKVFRFVRTFAEPPAPSVRNRRLSGDTASVSFRRPHFGSGDRVSDCRDAFRLVLAFFRFSGVVPVCSGAGPDCRGGVPACLGLPACSRGAAVAAAFRRFRTSLYVKRPPDMSGGLFTSRIRDLNSGPLHYE